MHTALVVLHYFICIFLIVVILLQAGKGADIGAAFGGASQTVFGGRGPATFLSKMTTVVAILFLIISVTLAKMSAQTATKSIIDTTPTATETAPAPVPQDAADTKAAPPVEQIPAEGQK